MDANFRKWMDELMAALQAIVHETAKFPFSKELEFRVRAMSQEEQRHLQSELEKLVADSYQVLRRFQGFSGLIMGRPVAESNARFSQEPDSRDGH